MHIRQLAIGAIGFFLLGGTAIAQSMPPPGAMAGPHGGMRHGDPAARAKHHADKLRAALQLTPAQEPALTALVASMKPPEGGGAKMHGDRQAMAALTTPQRLDMMLVKMDDRRARMVEHTVAVKRFYAQLTPSQQKAFDALRPDHEGRRGGRMGGGHGTMGHGMGPGQPG